MFRRPSRFLRALGVAGLLIGLLAATIVPAAAQDDDTDDGAADAAREIADFFGLEDDTLFAGNNTVFYPWVANDDDFGLGAADTSISVQNLEDIDAQIFIYIGTADGGFELETTAYLSSWAAKSFSAEDLGIAEGEGAPVAVAAYALNDDAGIIDADFPDAETGDLLAETPVVLSKPVGVVGDFTQVIACVVNAYADEDLTFGEPVGFIAAVDVTVDGTTYAAGDAVPGDFTQADLQTILDDANAGNTGALVNPFGGLNNDGDCFDARTAGEEGTFLNSVAIGGVAKQAVEGESLPTTTGADTAVSGYNAVNGVELATFDEWYLPIVQTNCGPGGCWDSTIRVANFNNLNSAVTIRFFPADDGSGSLQTGFQIQESVDGGETIDVTLSDLVPEGWVGSAHILSDGAVFAMVDRFKVGYNMWITNTGSSADFENLAQVEGGNGAYALFAPHVLLDYFGWNTGINVANLADQDNNVSIQYFNLLGNATQVLNQRLAAHGMTYFYDPSIAAQDNNAQDVDSDPNANIVGSAIIWSDFPVAAAVDATKYPESDPTGGVDVFQATSYSATQNVFTFQAVPLVQKGNPVDGMGDTSGVNIMNPNATATTANVFWINPSGFLADNFGTSSVTIPGFANGFVYTLTQRNLPNGFTGAAQVVADQPVAAVSANVNYQVDGDGSAIFNAFNPCGFFRVAVGDCFFGNPLAPTEQTFTKSFVDQFGEPVEEVAFYIVGGNPDFPTQRNGTSLENGSMTFENLPAGDYELFVTAVPDGIAAVDPDVALDTFTLDAGEDESITNELTRTDAPGFTKTVIVAGSDVDDDAATVGTTLTGVDVIVYEQIGTDAFGDPILGDVAFTGQTDAEGMVGESLAEGGYVLCLFDADGFATTSDSDTVGVELGTTAEGSCAVGDTFVGDVFTIGDDVADDLINEVDVFPTEEGFTTVFFEGFEDGNSDGWLSDVGGTPYGAITVVPSGNDGIESSSGNSHAVFSEGNTSTGPFTDFGGYSDEWPEGGFVTSIDIYLDVSWALGEGFDYSVAANGTDGAHQRDFVFQVAKDTSTQDLLVGVANGSAFVTNENLELLPDFYEVTESGWYTFQHVFYDNGSGVLAVDLNLIDSAGNIVFTQTLSEPADVIGTEVGGNRYGWFTFIDVAGGIAVDNAQLQVAAPTP